MKTKFISYTRNLKTINFMLHDKNYVQGTIFSTKSILFNIYDLKCLRT